MVGGGARPTRFQIFTGRCWSGNGSGTRRAEDFIRKRKMTNGLRSTGRRSNIIRGRSRNSPSSTWQRISKIQEHAFACCWGLMDNHRRATKRAHSYGRCWPIYGPIPRIAFHSKLNSLGGYIISLITQTLKPGGLGDNFEAFVITNDATNFSVGANLMLLLMSVQEEEWDDVDLMIRQFQGMTQAIKFSPKPVVVAPFGLTLGGGTEISLHAAARQPHAELYMGLVEVGVGLLPGGGGCKEMLLRAVDSAALIRLGGRAESVELMEAMKRAFETIATAKVATSAHEARGLRFLAESDAITMNRERVLNDAKACALELVCAGHEPPVPRVDIPAPGENVLATLKLGIHLMRQAEYISDHDVKVGTKVAEVICGGNVSPGTPVSEQYLLDLEREGFKSLCGEKKTQERIQFTLKTGKPLRN